MALLKTTILYIVPSSGIGGAETFLLHTAGFHDPQSIRAVYCFFQSGPLVKKIQTLGWETRIAPKPPRLSRPWTFFRTLRWLRTQIQETQADLVHSTMAYSVLWGAPAAWHAGKPHIWFQHGPVSGWLDFLAALFPSERILANSNYTKSAQLKLSPWNPSRVEVLRLGVDFRGVPDPAESARSRSRLREEWQCKPEDFVVGMLCRPQKQKGTAVFEEAIHRAQAELKDRTLVGYVFGGTENEARDVVSSSLKFLPYTDSPLPVMAALDVVVNASILPEGFGLTLIEAMSVGRVPVGPNEGGPTEIIKNDENGLLFQARNAQHLATMLVKLCNDPSFYARLAINAQSDAKKHFDAEQTIRNLERIYEIVLSSWCARTDQEKNSE